MKSDPPVRADGKCAVCKKRRKETERRTDLTGWLDILAADPFCSTTCCKRFHKCEVTDDGRARGIRQGRRPTPRWVAA